MELIFLFILQKNQNDLVINKHILMVWLKIFGLESASWNHNGVDFDGLQLNGFALLLVIICRNCKVHTWVHTVHRTMHIHNKAYSALKCTWLFPFLDTRDISPLFSTSFILLNCHLKKLISGLQFCLLIKNVSFKSMSKPIGHGDILVLISKKLLVLSEVTSVFSSWEKEGNWQK